MFTNEDIRAAFFSLPRNKAAGPDGYSAEFFRSCWTVVGPEVISAVKEFFITGQLLKQWNATTLALIPKITNASSVTEFRPISCCNSTLYKVVSKLLASRLQEFLPSAISHTQSAFIKGRLLVENVLLATEIIQGYNRKNADPRAMLKVDLRKAFDSVRWDFILTILKVIGIPDRFINWISLCLTTPTFSVSVNGHIGGFFKSTRGIRQGDALSPYLFVMVMEVFSKLLDIHYTSAHIGYHPHTANLNISHLMFADDVMIFFDGSTNSLHGINEALDLFGSWSGLQMNPQKTELFISGVNPLESQQLSTFGFPIGSLPIRYLGLPLMHRKLKISEYSPLLDKLEGHFKSWAVKALSYAGRLQLLSSVISGTVNFWISAFILPKGCIAKIESMCSRFLWTGSIENFHSTKVAWTDVCLPKEEGGLGLRRYAVWNNTLCLRLIWLLFSQGGSLWVAWHRHHNLKELSFWAVEEKQSDSWNWKSLLRLRHLAERFISCAVGNGNLASFWYDSWTPFGPLIKYFGLEGPRVLRVPINAKISEASDQLGWRLAAPRSETALQLHVYLTTVNIPSASDYVDSYSWTVNGTDMPTFSSAKTWECLRPRDSTKHWFSSVWFKGATPKHAFMMWLSTLDRLPTRSRLVSWGMQIPSTCCMCSVLDETRDHLLLSCEVSVSLWKLVLRRLGFTHLTFHSWIGLLAWTMNNGINSPSMLRKIVVQATVYHLWRERNNRLYNQQTTPTSVLFKILDRQIRNTISSKRHRRKFRDLMGIWLQWE